MTSWFDWISDIWSGTGWNDSGSMGYLGDIGSSVWDFFGGGGDSSSGGSSSSGSTSKDDSSFLGDLFSNKNVAGAITTGGLALLNSENKDAAKAASAEQYAQEQAMMERKFEMEKELLALKAALGGGGGGGDGGVAARIAHEKALARYQARLEALKNRMDANSVGARNMGDAYAAIQDAVLSPVRRR